MVNKIWFMLTLIAIVSLHAFVLQSYKIKQEVIAIPPAKTISKTINLQRVAIKKLLSVVIEKPIKKKK